MDVTTYDAKLEELLKITRDLLNASVGEDLGEIGRQLDLRQCLIDGVKSAGGFENKKTPEQQVLADKILKLDAEVHRNLDKRSKNVGNELRHLKQKSAGMMKYNSSSYNLSSGQLLDRCK